MKIKQLMIGFIVVFTAILSFGAAVHAAEEHVAVQNGTLSGTVTNLQGEPLSEISISAVRTNENHFREYYDGTTDANGMYALSLPADVYDVSFSGHNDEYIPSWDLTEDEQLNTISVEEGTATTIDIVLPRWSAISGTITFTEGVPIPSSVKLYFLEEEWSDGRTRIPTIKHIEQMPDGTFSWTLTHVVPNIYTLCAFASVDLGSGDDVNHFYQCYGGTTIEDTQLITVGAEETMDNLSISFTWHYHTLSGRVTDQTTGEPLSGIDVNVRMVGGPSDSMLPQESNVETDVNGVYELPVVDGLYQIWLNDERHGSRYGEELLNMYLPASTQYIAVSGADVEENIVMERQYGISGRLLTMEGFRPHNLQLDVYEWDDSRNEWSSVALKTIQLDRDEYDYFIGGIPHGTYRVCVYSTAFFWYVETPVACYDGGANVADGTDVVMLEGADTTGIDIQYRGMGRVTGILTDEQGNPLAGIHVSYHPTPWFEEARPFVITADDGSFDMALYPNTPYMISFNTPYGPYIEDRNEQYISQGYSDSPIFIEADETLTITAALVEVEPPPPANSTLQGTILLESGESIAWGHFGLEKFDEERGRYSTIVIGDIAAGGVYSATQLTAGTYRLCYSFSTIHSYSGSFYDGDIGAFYECYEQQNSEETATEIVIGEGEAVTLDFTTTGPPRLESTAVPEPTLEPSETATPIPTPEIIIPEDSGQSSGGEPIPLGVTLNQTDGSAVSPLTLIMIVVSTLLVSSVGIVVQEKK